MKTDLTPIKREVIANGGEYRKLKMLLNGQDAYEVNGRIMTKRELVERFRRGEL